MVAITEPAMVFDGIRSLKGFSKTRRVSPGPMPNRPGRMQSTTAEPRGRRRSGLEFCVLSFGFAQRHDLITNFASILVRRAWQRLEPSLTLKIAAKRFLNTDLR